MEDLRAKQKAVLFKNIYYRRTLFRTLMFSKIIYTSNQVPAEKISRFIYFFHSKAKMDIVYRLLIHFNKANDC
jgi:hypothetical protein